MSIDFSKLGGPYDVVFDVGTNEGQFASQAFEAWPDCRVFGFEPIEAASAKAFQNLSDKNFTVVGIALSDKEGEEVFYQNEVSVCSSLLPMGEIHKEAFPFSRNATPVRVKTGLLESYLTPPPMNAFLKIDVQGAEGKVLTGAGKSLSVIEAILLEVNHEPCYEGAWPVDYLWEWLRRRGFRFAETVDELYHPETGVLLQSDALFLNVN